MCSLEHKQQARICTVMLPMHAVALAGSDAANADASASSAFLSKMQMLTELGFLEGGTVQPESQTPGQTADAAQGTAASDDIPSSASPPEVAPDSRVKPKAAQRSPEERCVVNLTGAC